MWDKKKAETDSNPPQTHTPLRPTAPVSSVAGAVTPPARVTPDPALTGASIGKAVRIIGDVVSEEDLFIDGEIQGSLAVRNSKLTIGPNGRAKSDVIAREVVIQGQVHGNVEASQKITIRKDGSLVGNIKTTGIIIEDDAYFKGSIDIVRHNETART